MNHDLPAGFRFAGIACGLKSDPHRRDLTLIVADNDSAGAGVYTQNVVHAASVARNRGLTPGNRLRAVLINSGNANACTGKQGRIDVQEMAALAANACGVEPDQVLVMSTGVIGLHLPMDKIASGIHAAASELTNSKAAFAAAAEAIMTTDQFAKVANHEVELDGHSFRVAAMAKGAGMIGPNMATMLAVVMTDAPLDAETAQRLLANAVDESFNCISVEGHMSTSDTVLLLANGAAGGVKLTSAAIEQLQQTITETCTTLARMIPDDGEGASHRIEIVVTGSRTREDARKIARTVADSPLVKTGIAGADPNWGRIVSAAGYAGVPFNPDRLRLSINGTLMYEQGEPVAFDARKVSESIRDKRDVFLEITLAEGDASIRFWTSDMTVDYVRFNSEYTT